MGKRIGAAITGIVWASGIASAAVLTYALNRPVVSTDDGVAGASMADRSALRPTRDEKNVSSVLEVPLVTIFGDVPRRRGVAEMQGVRP